MNSTFDYEAAKKAGYNDEEIESFLGNLHPNFDKAAAKQAGYSDEEIDSYLSSLPEKEKTERSITEQILRSGAQYGLGLLEATPSGIVYNTAVAPLNSKAAQTANYRELLGDEIEQLTEQKATGVWSEEDEKFLQHAKDQLVNYQQGADKTHTVDLSMQGLIEKATGIDLNPEGILENAARWTGFIKDPKKLFELGKTGLKASDAIRAIAPGGRELLRGAGAGTALEVARRGDFGPIGTMAAAVIGDIGGNVAGLGGKAVKKIVSNPREAIAEVLSKFTPKDKKKLQEEIINEFRKANIQPDVGTITNSDLVKWVQSRLAQSGLTGKGLDELKDTITKQIKEEYKAVADSLGEAKYATKHEAGEITRESLKKIRDKDLDESRQLYKNAINELPEDAAVNPTRVATKIKEIEKSLKPGQVKSSEQSQVLNILNDIKRDISNSEGEIFYAKVKDLINNKIALNDIIDHEVQGGSKQLLKGLVKDLDRAIISYGQESPRFAKNYINANKRFSQHAKTFRNRDVSKYLNAHDPQQLMNAMNSVQGIRDMRSILSKTPEGKQVFDGISRLKLDEVIGNNMVDSVTQQMKLGTFSKLLENPAKKDAIREILGPQAFKRLQRVQNLSGKLAESAQKFFNASKSGVTIEDVGIVTKVLSDLGLLLSGNPWPLIKSGAGISSMRYLTNLLSDPQFLRLVEELVVATENNNVPLMDELSKSLLASIRVGLDKEND